jgi:polyisoprenoid-binding protein YceI
VTFRSTKVEGRETTKGVYALRITGELTLHGVTRSTLVPMRVELSGDTLVATGGLVIATLISA